MNHYEELHKYHQRMYADGLVIGTQGNISVRTDTGICIKPSGVEYADLAPGKFVDVRMDGFVPLNTYKPSTDTDSHLVIYEKMSWINAIVHTHSTFATAFAACGLPIGPVCLTAMADEFGGVIPCSEFAEIGGKDIGHAVVMATWPEAVAAHVWGEASHAVLLRNHGLFTVGESIEKAYKHALYAEDCARTLFYARQIGQVAPMDSKKIKSAYERYHTTYGQ